MHLKPSTQTSKLRHVALAFCAVVIIVAIIVIIIIIIIIIMSLCS
jgi:hypothetical protein